ncbi:hypothetical protein [Nitrospirillum pindoramense]|uniref:Uncharacterized protein n=1 Tax=Nitrospirillum amazonense TaxID=28077 RepID=A0A560HC08_9PROT|nr:hypothetical protein [Nitrospirillum amazonense]TWB43905.1 hypothetical protein FBZ90_104293 [Nitrospirillum amazonense]
MRFSILVVAALVACLTTPAFAFDAVATGKVRVIEASYVPDQVNFQLDTAVGACPAGAWLNWVPTKSTDAKNADSVNAVYSLVTTALASGKGVTVYVTNTNCMVNFIYLQSN